MRWLSFGIDGRLQNNGGRIDIVSLTLWNLKLDAVVGPWLDVPVSVAILNFGAENASESVSGRGIRHGFINTEALCPVEVKKFTLDFYNSEGRS